MKDIWIKHVTNIDSNAFQNNEYLETITFGESLVTIGNNAFEGCTGLKYLDYQIV